MAEDKVRTSRLGFVIENGSVVFDGPVKGSTVRPATPQEKILWADIELARRINQEVLDQLNDAKTQLHGGLYCSSCGAQIHGEGSWPHDDNCPRKDTK